MPLLHTIRLKGPWEFQWIPPLPADSGQSDGPLSGQVKLPATWQACFGDRSGRVRWSRRFQRPTNLEATGRVLIAGRGIRGVSAIQLGDVALGSQLPADQGFLVDVTEVLAPSNVISFEQEGRGDDEHAGLGLPITIEIWSDLSGGLAPQV
jgi:hypothetical protein